MRAAVVAAVFGPAIACLVAVVGLGVASKACDRPAQASAGLSESAERMAKALERIAAANERCGCK